MTVAANSNFFMQRIICGDNLEVMRTIPDESVDLCYIDPPFFSGRNYAVIWGDGAEIRQFEDRWVEMGDDGKYSKDINTYLNWMEPRIREIKRILKKTGSFYLHCDWHADSYLRVLCDDVFGYDNLQGKITWKRCAPHALKNGFDNINDTILYYSKSSKFIFNQPYIVQDNLDKFKYIEEDTGRKFYPVRSLEQKQNFKFRGEERTFYKPDGTPIIIKSDIGWRWSQSHIDKKWKENHYIFHFNSNGNVSYKGYADEYKGQKVHCLWDDITYLSGVSKESLGYPTQKPEALLERIIKASSNEGDVVLDAFCGCGTTITVAAKLNRQFIGIDVSQIACRLMADRLEGNGIEFPKEKIEGLPLTSGEIADLSGWEFQNWINREFGAINGKRGADGGIDGKYFDTLIQVKKYRAGRPDLDGFVATLYRERQKEGIYIALGYTSTFMKEVNRLKREDGIEIFPFTADDILAGNHKESVKSFNPLYRD